MPKPEIKKVDKPIVEEKVHQEKQVELFEEKIQGNAKNFFLMRKMILQYEFKATL